MGFMEVIEHIFFICMGLGFMGLGVLTLWYSMEPTEVIERIGMVIIGMICWCAGLGIFGEWIAG